MIVCHWIASFTFTILRSLFISINVFFLLLNIPSRKIGKAAIYFTSTIKKILFKNNN
ncbi:hypothetical protein JCM21738_5178 [Mesobacillus boroniphilus JCM 21738]|uniref:Uncharacterized protein n=1 Tax=Mesobacillus boroniphilus JCM 21738 TaxID=1294265 RepID=W4RUK3_9BACI|nr:hypothetical protein JCM21738_5178 [Mesobacillus boroniphilus JCM 21738]